LNQTYQNIEVIAVDDGSRDNSLELLRAIDDSRLRIFSQINQGAPVARNRGLYESKGEYVKFLDADDFLYPDAIATQVSQIEALGEGEDVFGDFDFVDEEGKVIQQPVIPELDLLESNQDLWLFIHWEMLTTSPLHHRDNLLKVGGFNVSLKGGQEAYLHLAMSLAGVKFVYRPCRVMGYRSYQSEDRISCKRYDGLPNLGREVGRREATWELVQKKYGSKETSLSTSISQGYFNIADKYLRAGMAEEGRYCMLRADSIPHDKRHPRYRGSRKLAKLYYLMGYILGFRSASAVMDRLTVMAGLKRNESSVQKMVLGGSLKK